LSCFVKAKNFGCITFCDDKRAINYAKRYIELGEIVGIIHLIKEAYIRGYIGDNEVSTYQNRLNKNKFKIQGDLLSEVAAEKLRILMEGKAIS
jgi:predicted nucleic acid-binding protein